MQLKAHEIAQYTHGQLIVGDPETEISGLSWDSREIEPGMLYVALPGERVDGHDFIASTLVAGARGVLVSKDMSAELLAQASDLGCCVIQVADSAHALSDLAAGWRGHLKACVIALTGSSGKTTTKNMLRDVLSCAGSVVATKANQNNELGVPRTVLQASRDTDFLIVEMGMRGRHQIDVLCEFVLPDVALITNVGESHIELLGSREEIARAKAEIGQLLPQKGCLFINAGDGFADCIKEHAQTAERGVETRLFDARDLESSNAFIQAHNIVLDAQGFPRFDLQCGTCAPVPVALGLRGRHNVWNALAVAGVAQYCGMSQQAIAQALSSVQGESQRQEIMTAANGALLMDDSYNANPESMSAALELFSSMQVAGKHIAVVGDMGELGFYTQEGHERVGRLIAGLDIDYLVCIGEHARIIARAAREAGFSASAVTETDSIDEAIACVSEHMGPKDAVLVKASHSMGLDRVIKGLLI